MQTHPLIETVLTTLKPYIGDTPRHFLLACSGGADSTALLLIFHRLQQQLSCRLSAVTVNHNIRSAAESAADAQFVADLCRNLRPPVPCLIKEIPSGTVARCAAKRKRGIEDAARLLRYRIFEKTAAAVHADFIVTAHNKNDAYETVLMRMFQGGGTESLHTMPVQRGIYLRPLVTENRLGLEAFLRQQGVSWREDSTNAENRYLRNRIRHFLIPALTETFGSWMPGLDKTVRRISLDCAFCNAVLQEARTAAGIKSEWQICRHGAVKLSAAFFFGLSPALRLKVLEHGCRRLNVRERIPAGILFRMAECVPQTATTAAGNLRLETHGEHIFLFKSAAYRQWHSRAPYSIYIERIGSYAYPLGKLDVYATGCGIFVKDSADPKIGIGPVTLPLTVRNRCGGDRIATSGGGSKKVKKILNEWAVDSLSRDLLPIIIENNHLRALYGSPLGYKNWFVEENSNAGI